MIIDTFHANYFIPIANADPYALKKRFDRVAANLLEQEIEPLLARISLDPSVLVFIKKLSLRLVLDPFKTDDRGAARLWAQRLAAAVDEVVQTMPLSPAAAGASGKESNSNVALFQNRAAYLAHFIHDLTGTPGPPGEVLNKWYYSQFRDLSSLAPAQIVKVLCKQNRHIIETVFSLLEQLGGTERILGALNEADAWFLYSLLPGESPEPGKAIERKETDHYEQVLGFITAVIQKGLISPEFIYSCTRSYKLCLKIYMLFLVLQKKYPVPGAHAAVKEIIREIVFERPGSIVLPRDRGSAKTVEEGGMQKAKTAYGGLFLLIPVLREMYLVDILRASSLPDRDNISAVNALLFSIASAVIRQNRNPVSHPYIDAADPGFFIFAGLEPTASFHYLQTYPEVVTPTLCKDFLVKLSEVFGSAETFFQKGFCPPEALNFEIVISTISELVLRSFARRLKGFEASSGAYLFNHFLHRFSEVRWDRRSVRVILSPKPLDTVLRMAGLLDETGKVSWLENRNVTFQIAR